MPAPAPPGRRARDLGIVFDGIPGALNAITDLHDVHVGLATVVRDAPVQVRTGVTAIVPHASTGTLVPWWAGVHAFNGNGEMTGTHWIRDAGWCCGPICITSTHSVGVVHHAAVRWMIERHRADFEAVHLWAMPVVAETYDGVLSDILGQHVTEAHARAALDAAAPGPVAEGNVGGGTGMICYDFKGGTGTASRRVSTAGVDGHVAALVQANHGTRDWLTVAGVPVGRNLRDGAIRGAERGSIIVVLGTDLPLLPHQLARVARRAAIGIGRGGTPGGSNSGDLFLCFGTANRIALPQHGAPTWTLTALNDEHFDPVYAAAVQAVEEAVINAMLAAADTPTWRPRGGVVRAIDPDALCAVLRAHGRMAS
ncbi:MAG: P1 family peptidase [Burkholderiales bacterium]|jgi:D-aminopeptidase|nr:P1 family peptidase [Burkholderiales bacterium]